MRLSGEDRRCMAGAPQIGQ